MVIHNGPSPIMWGSLKDWWLVIYIKRGLRTLQSTPPLLRTQLRIPSPASKSIVLLCFIVAIGFPGCEAIADNRDPSINIIYPATRSPLNRVFQRIVNGIALNPQGDHKVFVVDQNTNASSVSVWLDKTNAKNVISLGRQSLSVLEQSGWRGNHVVGGLFARPGELKLPGVSLYLDPAAISKYLKILMPGIQRVFVASLSTDGTWINEANERGSIPRFEVHSLSNDYPNVELTRYYWETVNNMQTGIDALWLDHRIDSELLYELVEKAWVRNVVLISTNLSHVDRGVLFVLYPDNEAMGRRLEDIALEQARDKAVQLEPLKEVNIAINRKVADHLNIRIHRDLDKRLGIVVR